MDVRSVGLCLKPDQHEIAPVIGDLRKWLEDRGLAVRLDVEAARQVGDSGLRRHELAERVDLVIVLGGDGTLLAVARALGTHPVPILGVNLGTLGFLAEIARDEIFETLDAVLGGRFVTERRMRLDVAVMRDGQEVGRYLALNEAVIANSTLSRMVELEAAADGQEVALYHADGLIVATPTGSTAYSLSAGGPLLLPAIEAILITPICPHSLTQRPLVVPQTCRIEIRNRSRSDRGVQLTVDGQVGRDLAEGDRVTVLRSEHPVRMLVRPDRNRFDVLRAKLRWGER